MIGLLPGMLASMVRQSAAGKFDTNRPDTPELREDIVTLMALADFDRIDNEHTWAHHWEPQFRATLFTGEDGSLIVNVYYIPIKVTK